TGAVSAFRAASSTYNLLYELLVGGLISSALVPVLSEYAERDRYQYRQLLGSLILLLSIGVSGIVVVLEAAAPLVTWLISPGFGSELKVLTTVLIRTMLPAVLLMGLAGLLSAALYALQEFAYPAFMAAIFNAAIIVCAIVFRQQFEVRALALGVLIGSAAQLLLQIAGLRTRSVQPLWAIFHPAVKRVIVLSAPVLASLVIGQAQVVIDRNLASRTGEQSIAWMANATTLIQFPLGLIAAAISLATLPRLSRLASVGDNAPFLATLAFSLRLVVVLILPATAMLLVLGTPLIRLLFEHGRFLPSDTVATANALQLYVIGLPFAAIDQSLILAFYARHDTLRPALVGIAAVGIYLAVALSTAPALGMLGLVLANSAQWFGHAMLMIVLTRARLGRLSGYRLVHNLGQVTIGSLVAAAVMAIALRLLSVASLPTIGQEALLVLVPGTCGAASYAAIMWSLRNEETISLFRFLQARARSLSRPM
ncbi:MAG: murein biosynthesis integral membrane protein MurJ, partial [Anaerolineae bacterium]